ncbi:MAG TPA: hypothetical protein PLF81_04820 [Candidatus Anammoximicrobium sp.]|nr:hypothetical protein [Candidatus Anammoximicrobium sp.]
MKPRFTTARSVGAERNRFVVRHFDRSGQNRAMTQRSKSTINAKWSLIVRQSPCLAVLGVNPATMQLARLDILDERRQEPINDLKQLGLCVQCFDPLVAVKQIVSDPMGDQQKRKHDVVQVVSLAQQCPADGNLTLRVGHQEPLKNILDITGVEIAISEVIKELGILGVVKTPGLVRVIDGLTNGANVGPPATGDRFE